MASAATAAASLFLAAASNWTLTAASAAFFLAAFDSASVVVAERLLFSRCDDVLCPLWEAARAGVDFLDDASANVVGREAEASEEAKRISPEAEKGGGIDASAEVEWTEVSMGAVSSGTVAADSLFPELRASQ